MIKIFVTILAMTSSFAFAEAPRATLGSWEDIKRICESPDVFGMQQPPGQLEITCTTSKLAWQIMGQEPFSYPRTQSVTVEMVSDKADLALLEGQVLRQPSSVGCPVVQQVSRNYRVTANTSCSEITAFEGDFVKYCQQQLQDDTDDLNQFLVEEVVLQGSEHSLCMANQSRRN